VTQQEAILKIPEIHLEKSPLLGGLILTKNGINPM
jgi:hypothetical protein